jgi:hypothetical protein
MTELANTITSWPSAIVAIGYAFALAYTIVGLFKYLLGPFDKKKQ